MFNTLEEIKQHTKNSPFANELFDDKESDKFKPTRSFTEVSTLSTGYKFVIEEFHNVEKINPSKEYNEYLATTIISDSAVIELISPLKIKFENIEDTFFCYNDFLNLSASGDSFEDVLSSFANFFIFDFRTYEITPEAELTRGAKELLFNYKSIIKNVEWL